MITRPSHIQLSNFAFVRQVIRQTIKDFSMVSLELDEVDDEKDWYASLITLIKQTFAHDRDRLVQLLYRVDLSEEMVGREITGKTEDEAALILATLILKRETNKVALRIQYSEDEGQETN
ncbi:MAG: hypothetical protein HKN32_07285 [Flavobacteriales bacterium]|nr:hypothetical protein [Flavobacteriales bacterium]